MAFILIVPSLAVGMLLDDEGPNWPYACTQMNDTMAHVPLSSEGHICIMTDGIPSMNACSHLDQLQVQKVLQCGGWVVCPEGLNGSLEALLFNFEELPLWNAATVDEPIWDLPLIEVSLNGLELEAPPPTRAKDSLNLKGMDLTICDLVATSLQASWHVVMPENIHSIVQVSHSASPPTMLRSLEVTSISLTPQSQTPQGWSSWPDRWGALTARGYECSIGVAARD